MIYLDHNSTTPIHLRVKEEMIRSLDFSYNASSIHKLGREAKGLINKARTNVLESLSLKDYNLIFTSSGTEANNFLIANFIDHNILISPIEHLSIIEPVKRALNWEFIKVNDQGQVKLEELEEKLKNLKGKTIISVMLANNETGVIQFLSEIIKIARKYDALIHSDLSQAYGKVEIKGLDLDFITLSAHKTGGPIGVGAFIYKDKHSLKPLIMGGGQELGLKAGTENLTAINGFGVIASIIKETGSNLFKSSLKQRNYLEEKILNICPDVQIFAKDALRIDNTSMFTMPKVKSEVQIINFDLAGICISAGSACSSGKISKSHVLEAIGAKDGEYAIRVSIGPNQSDEDIDCFINEWEKIYHRLNSKD